MLLTLLALSAQAVTYADPSMVSMAVTLPAGTEIPEKCVMDVNLSTPPSLVMSSECEPVAPVLNQALADGWVSWRAGEDVGERVHVHIVEGDGAWTMVPVARVFVALHPVRMPRKVAREGARRCHMTVRYDDAALFVGRFIDCDEDLRDLARDMVRSGVPFQSHQALGIDRGEHHIVLAAMPELQVGNERRSVLIVEGEAKPAIRGPLTFPRSELDRTVGAVPCRFRLQLDARGTVLGAERVEAGVNDPCTRPFEEAFRKSLKGWAFYPKVVDGRPVPSEFPFMVRFRAP